MSEHVGLALRLRPTMLSDLDFVGTVEDDPDNRPFITPWERVQHEGAVRFPDFRHFIIEAGVGQIPTQLSRLSMTHQVRDLLAPLIERTAEVAPVSGWLITIAMLLGFAVVMFAAAAAVFTLREFAGSAES